MKMFLTTLVAMVSMAFASHSYASGSISGNSTSVQEYTYDFAVDGGAVGLIDLSKKFALPVGSVIESGYYMVQTAMTSGGSATVSIGDAANGARYKALTAYNNGAYAANTPAAIAIGVPVYIDVANVGKFGMTVAVAALTAGKIKFWLVVHTPKG